MALELSRKIEKYEIVDILGELSFKYTVEVESGELIKKVSGVISDAVRTVAMASTTNGVDIKVNLSSIQSQDIASVAEKIQLDLIEVYNNYQNYIT